MLKRINQLIAGIGRNGHEGIGKPAPLGNDLSGHWSRHINSEHRLAPRIRSSLSPAARRSARDSGVFRRARSSRT
ncbi:type II toxin-antitoxin system YoeB family toxin [Streptomyces sp. CA2R106]|uniref:type II toxin-antitoxin system YoeB family toxin n=1 Tax=Streptomyces sp. CA2R106 TaxID=3120153 RepID=UPI003FA7A69A